MHQRGDSTDQKSRCPHITLRFEEAPLMRLSVGTLRQVVERDLSIAFVPQQLTSYGGLELLRRYVRRLDLPRRLQAACAALGGDYGGARLALLLLALPYVGARRLEHLQYLVGDPLVRRFAGLARVPTARTVSNWLRRFTQETLRPLIRLNQDLVLDTLARLDVPRLTLDVDGTIVRTGATVAWAFRGFNPHHRKDRSILPAARPRRADRPHPAGQEPPGQRARLQAIGRVPPRAHRRGPGPPGPAPAPRIPHGCRVFPARCAAAACCPELRVCHQGGLLELAAPQAVGRRAPALARAGPRRDRLRAPARHPAVEPPPAGDALPQARPASEPQELPARSVQPGRWAFRVLRRRHEPAAVAARALRLHRRPRRPGEDDRRTQGRVRARRRPDAPLRRQLCLAATQHRLQRRPELSTRHYRHPSPPVPQAHVRLRPAYHADVALPADHPGRAADSDRGPQCPPSRAEPGDRSPLRPHSPCARGLSYFRIGVNFGIRPTACGRG